MEDDQQINPFNFKWRYHQSTFIQNFYTFLKSGTLVDCTLMAEGQVLKVHKVVLSAFSPYFKRVLSERYDEHPVFPLKVKFKELKAIIDFMYRGEVNVSRIDELLEVVKIAKSLQIKGLSENENDTGSSKTKSRRQKTVSQSTAPSLDIPHASDLIEKNNVPRQTLMEIPTEDLSEDLASPQVSKGLSSRKDSQNLTSRKRKRSRRRNLTEDNTVENQDASNSNNMPQQMGVLALGITPVAEENVHAGSTDLSDFLGRSALMGKLIDTRFEKGVEDLLDEHMNNLNDMEQDNNRAGPSHARHPARDVIDFVTGAPGATDEAQEANDNERSWTNAELEKHKVRDRYICFNCSKNFKRRQGLQQHLKKNVCNKKKN